MTWTPVRSAMLLTASGVLGQTAIGLIDQGHAAGVLVPLQFEHGQIRVIQDVVADPRVAHQVQQQVLVDEREAELLGGHRPGDGHDGVGHRRDRREACRVVGHIMRITPCLHGSLFRPPG